MDNESIKNLMNSLREPNFPAQNEAIKEYGEKLIHEQEKEVNNKKRKVDVRFSFYSIITKIECFVINIFGHKN